MRAIAVVTALAVDAVVDARPRAESGAEDPALEPRTEAAPPAAAATPPPAEARPAPALPPRATTPRSANPAPARGEPLDPLRDVPRREQGSVSPRQYALELGARATLSYAKAPTLLPGAELFVVVADPQQLKWLLQVGAAGERGSRSDSGPGAARFSFVGGRVEGCFFGIPLRESLRLMPCAVLEGGAVVVEGTIVERTEESRTVVDPWFALGLNARLSADLGWATALLEAGPTFPLRPDDRVVFGSVERPRYTVHDVPWAGGFVALGLAPRIP